GGRPGAYVDPPVRTQWSVPHFAGRCRVDRSDASRAQSATSHGDQMKFATLALLGAICCAAQNGPVCIILVGDSTVAPVNGWGPGFCALASREVTCINLGKNGRSTSSYRA